MNVVKSSRNSSSSLPKGGSTTVVDEASSSNNNNINLYQDIPNIEVSLDDFEEFALDRLKVRNKKALMHKLHSCMCNRDEIKLTSFIVSLFLFYFCFRF